MNYQEIYREHRERIMAEREQTRPVVTERKPRTMRVQQRGTLGPGGHLKRICEAFGQEMTAKCGCSNHASQMDRNGADWCRQNVGLIVGWLDEERQRRGLSCLGLAWCLVRRLPGAASRVPGVTYRAIDRRLFRFAAALLVRWAIRRATAEQRPAEPPT